jgi:hypothetical protein
MRFVLVLAMAVGCGDHDIAREITITQGVYGQVLDAAPTSDTMVTAYGPLGPSDPLSAADTNRDGVYQLPLVGDFWLCTPASCTQTLVHVEPGTRVRYDSTSGAWALVHSTMP